MSQTLIMSNHVQNIIRLEIAQLTVESFINVDILTVEHLHFDVLKELQEMIKFRSHALVTDVLGVTVELLNGICVIIATIAFKLRDVVVVVGGCGIYDVIKFVFVAEATWWRKN